MYFPLEHQTTLVCSQEPDGLFGYMGLGPNNGGTFPDHTCSDFNVWTPSPIVEAEPRKCYGLPKIDGPGFWEVRGPASPGWEKMSGFGFQESFPACGTGALSKASELKGVGCADKNIAGSWTVGYGGKIIWGEDRTGSAVVVGQFWCRGASCGGDVLLY